MRGRGGRGRGDFGPRNDRGGRGGMGMRGKLAHQHSNDIVMHLFGGLIAQAAESLPADPRVVGSNPASDKYLYDEF